MRRRFELIVFDWDGTLADSTGLIVAGMQRAIAALGLEPRADETIRSLIGIGFREALAELYPGHDPAELEAALMALRQRAGGDGQQHAPLYPGVRPLLGRLHGHRLPHLLRRRDLHLELGVAHLHRMRKGASSPRTRDRATETGRRRGHWPGGEGRGGAPS